MGFFSHKCAKTNLSIPAFPYAEFPKEFSEVVQVLPDNRIIEGIYDGYGRIGDSDIFEALAPFVLGKPDATREELADSGRWNDATALIKVVLKSPYNNETYAELPVSEHDETQGYFYNEMQAAELEEEHEKLKEDLEARSPK